MKRLLKFKGLLFFLAALSALTACSGKKQGAAEAAPDLSRGAKELVMEELAYGPAATSAEGMKEVAEAGCYRLYIDPLTTDVAVYDGSTGLYTHSNPENGLEDFAMDEVARGTYGAVLGITFTNRSGVSKQYSSYTDSVLLEQFACYEIESGVRVVYTLGVDESNRLLPPVLRKETYDRIMDALPAGQKADIKAMYRLVKKDSLSGISGSDILKTFPKLAEENLYLLREIKKYDKTLLEGALKEIGFTLEEVQEEMVYAGYEAEETDVTFQVPVDLQIDERGLRATVDLGCVKGTEEFMITELTLLKGFAATDAEEGFILVPDGSGVLLDLYNSETAMFSKQIYGADQTITAPFKSGYFMPAVMPVFGISEYDRAVFSVIEQGEAVANVVAGQRSSMVPLAFVSPEIVVNAKDYQDYGNLKTNPSGLVLPSEDPRAVVSVRYFFLGGEHVDYNDMAKLYQDYLVESGVLKEPEQPFERIPFYLEVPGAIKKKVSYAGIPVNAKKALTTYGQAQELLKLLTENGVDGSALRLRYVGWANDGLYNSVFRSIQTIGALGSKKDWNALMAYAEEIGTCLYLDAKFDHVYEDGNFDGFSYGKDASRQLDHKAATAGIYNPATLYQRNYGRYFLVSPGRMQTYAEEFLPEFQKEREGAFLSLGTMGRYLNSDYKVGSVITRERSEEYYAGIFEKAKEACGRVLTEQGNAYTWKHVSDIVNLPVGGSEVYAQKKAVPFVQMVLHGYIEYAAMPVNLSSDLSYEILKAAETGSGVYLQTMYEDDLALVDTEYDHFYSWNYENLLLETAELYTKAAGLLNEVAGAKMILHEQPAEGVSAVTYDNGRQIIVNYKAEPYEAGSIVVPGRDFVLVEVELE